MERGALVGLVGPSGAGKTTLFRLVAGALRPTAGTLRVLGRDLLRCGPAELRRLRRGVSVVPQGHGLVPNLTAAQNAAMGLAGRTPALASLRAVAWLDRAERRSAHAALHRLAVGGLLDQRVDQLSGGQQQRVAVARALVQDGELFLADEPVASVDGETAEVIMEVLAELARAGRAVVVSLHQPGLAARYCDRVVPLGMA